MPDTSVISVVVFQFQFQFQLSMHVTQYSAGKQSQSQNLLFTFRNALLASFLQRRFDTFTAMNALAAASRSDVSSLSVRMVDTVGSSRQTAAGRRSKPGD